MPCLVEKIIASVKRCKKFSGKVVSIGTGKNTNVNGKRRERVLDDDNISQSPDNRGKRKIELFESENWTSKKWNKNKA